MKFLTLVLFFTSLVSFSQDTIYTKSGEKIEAKVLVIDIDKIEYQKSSNLTGPIYELDKNQIDHIIFANGVTEEFAGEGESVNELTDRLEVNERIYGNRGVYYWNGARISRNLLGYKLLTCPDTTAIGWFRSGRNKKGASVFCFISMGVVGISAYFTSIFTLFEFGLNSSEPFLIIAAATALSEFGLLISAVWLNQLSKSHSDQAVHIYNENLAPTDSTNR